MPECLDLCGGDRPLRSIRDRSAAIQIRLGDPHTARPRLVAHLRFRPPCGIRSLWQYFQELLFLLGRQIGTCDGETLPRCGLSLVDRVLDA